MSHSIVRNERIHEMFAMLSNVSESELFDSIQSYVADEIQQHSILQAFKAMISILPRLSNNSQSVVRCLGIVGAASVSTAYWPYLILASALGIRVKIKVRPEDVHHISILSQIIATADASQNVGNGFDSSDWVVTVQSGDRLLKDGFWDECDRLLVFGSNSTVVRYRHHFPEEGRVIGFGHLESVMFVSLRDLQVDNRWIDDLLAFGHTGCLAPRVIVSLDDVSPEIIADVMLAKLCGCMSADVTRAVALRMLHHNLRVAGTDSWLSPDGMWLMAANSGFPTSGLAGHLSIVSKNTVVASRCIIGALTTPIDLGNQLPDLRDLISPATWACDWGSAQYPSMLWANGGVPILSTLLH